MYLYVERIRDFFGLCAIQIYFLLTYLLTYLLTLSNAKIDHLSKYAAWLTYS